MRRVVLIVSAVVIMCSCAFAQGDLELTGRGYISGGPMYGIQKFKTEWTEVEGADGTVYKIDPDNSWGLVLKGGYFINEYVAVEARGDYYNKFKQTKDGHADAGFGFGGADYDAEGSVKGYGVSLNGKVMYPVPNLALRPYVVGGLGFARFKFETSATVDTQWGSVSAKTDSQKYNGAFGRIGAGTMYFFTDSLGAEFEVAYNIGFGDISAARIISIYGGVIYAF